MGRIPDDLWAVLDELVPFLKLEFKEGTEIGGKKNPECRLDPTGLKYIHGERAKAQRIAEAKKKLDELIEDTTDKYKTYRSGILNILYL